MARTSHTPPDTPGTSLPSPDERPAPLACKSARPGRRTSRTAFQGEPPAEDDPLLSFTPVPHVAPRRNSITADRQRAFIAALAATGIVTQAAREIGASLEALYKLRNRPGAEGFRAAWEEALDRGVARLEDCALARAIEGEQRPIVSSGQLLGWYTRHDNALVQFLLRQRRSDRYSARNWAGNLKPGNPTYERIRKEIEAEIAEREAEEDARVFEEIDEFLEDMVQRRKANAAILAEDAGADEDSGGAPTPPPGSPGT